VRHGFGKHVRPVGALGLRHSELFDAIAAAIHPQSSIHARRVGMCFAMDSKQEGGLP